jgi:hypothetical protein
MRNSHTPEEYRLSQIFSGHLIVGILSAWPGFRSSDTRGDKPQRQARTEKDKFRDRLTLNRFGAFIDGPSPSAPV